MKSTAIFLSLLSFVGCLQTECANEVISELVSPDGTRKIVLFSRNCGATTGSSTQGTILNQGESLPNEPGSAFILDKATAAVSWEGSSRIVVTLEGGARVVKNNRSDRGVALEYRSN
jgi:hypothetical protein